MEVLPAVFPAVFAEGCQLVMEFAVDLRCNVTLSTAATRCSSIAIAATVPSFSAISVSSEAIGYTGDEFEVLQCPAAPFDFQPTVGIAISRRFAPPAGDHTRL